MKPRTPTTANEAATDPGVRAELRQRGLEPRRTLGQNFLADASLCHKVAVHVCAGAASGVLEIGAGLGALTAPLLALGCRVVAIETDPQLVSALREKFASQMLDAQLTLLHADAKDLDLSEALGTLPRPRVLAGNLPYHLSGLLLRRAVELSGQIDRAVFLLQLEVVERLCAAADSSAYGALTVFTRAVYAPRRLMIIRRGAFFPQPSVDSALVELLPLAEPVTIDAEFTLLVRAAFEKRRKTLRNAWREVGSLGATALDDAARAAEIDLGARGETLAVSDFARMAREVRARRQR